MTERQIEQQRLHSVLYARKSAFCCIGALRQITCARANEAFGRAVSSRPVCSKEKPHI